jgi:hypothetical protein
MSVQKQIRIKQLEIEIKKLEIEILKLNTEEESVHHVQPEHIPEWMNKLNPRFSPSGGSIIIDGGVGIC